MKAAFRVLTASFVLAASSLLAQAPASTEQTTPAQASANTTNLTQGTSSTSDAAQVIAAATGQEPDPATEGAADSADSKVRIVRLSQVRGKTLIDRGVGSGMEAAFANLPITQGTKLQVEEGIAEVEFEDTSTLRLTPGTVVEFPRLTRTPTGSTSNTINVTKGTVYVSLEKTKGNVYALTCDRGSAIVSPGSQVRLSLEASQPGLAVLTGGVQFTNLDGSNMRVGKDQELMLAASSLMKSDVIGDVEDFSYDDWYEDQEAYHKRYAKGSALSGSGSPYSYGLSDLNYYGSFADLPSCGNVWRPYFASAAWDPYGAGIWAWYPASGYSWVSPYPWGWAPFHYGAWQQCGGGLWGWAPGGGWTGLNNLRYPRMYPHPIHHPRQGDPPRHTFPVHPQPPHQGTAIHYVSVNSRPLTVSGVNTSTHDFVFRNDSAGIGIPRDMFGKLNKTAEHVSQHGPLNVPMMAICNESIHNGNSELHPGAIAARNHESVTWVPAGNGHDRQAWAANHTNSGNSAWAASHSNSSWANNRASGTNNGGGWSAAHSSGANGGGGWSGRASSGTSGGGWSGGHAGGSSSGGFSGGASAGNHSGGGAPAGGGGASAGAGAHH